MTFYPDLNIHIQTRIGAIFGLATNYDFDFGMSVFVNPNLKIHSIFPFRLIRYHQRVWENGLRIGLTWDWN